MAKKKDFCVAVDVKSMYHVYIQATSHEQALKMGEAMKTPQIRRDGKLIETQTEVVEVIEE
jgi:hypothetical protein